MNNKIAGLVQIELDGKSYTLRYDWNGIAEISELYPDGYNLMEPKQLAQILAIGLRREMPDATSEAVMDMSPPIISTMEVVSKAINCAYFGAPTAPVVAEEKSEENPPKKAMKRA